MTGEQLEWLQIAGAALDAANIGICISDAKGRFISANRAFCTLTGWAGDELSAKPIGLAGITLTAPANDSRWQPTDTPASAATNALISRDSRVLPTPGEPSTVTSCAWSPVCAAAKHPPR